MNDNANFTPGPWKTGDCDGFIIWAPRFQSVEWTESERSGEGVSIGDASCPGWALRAEAQAKLPIQDLLNRDKWIEECKANARLMATAPELYALAEQFERVAEYELRQFERNKPDDDEGIRLRTLNLNLIRESLAKVRGDQ